MPVFKARTTIPFPRLSAYLDTIIHSFSSHNMTLRREERGGAHAIQSSLGRGRLIPGEGELVLTLEAEDPVAFTRLKHELTGLLDFVARPENLAITWTGDRTGAMPPADLRVLTLDHVTPLTPRMRRLSFTGEDLERYATPAQIHCRLLFPNPDDPTPQWPSLDDNGRILWPESGKLASRIFTIRRVDPRTGRLDIDVLDHGREGPGATWARRAQPGDQVGILGPAAHGSRPADWYLLAGDDTGLPGIARILEDLPDTARGLTLIEVAGRAEEQPLAAPKGMAVRWLHRDGAPAGTTALLAEALRAADRPGDPAGGFAWIGAEYGAFRALRTHLRETWEMPNNRIVAFSHWRRGMSEDDIVKVGIASVLG